MTGYLIAASCPRCAGPLRHVTGHGDHLARGAVTVCDACDETWHVHVTIARVASHPSRAGERRRLRAKETQ